MRAWVAKGPEASAQPAAAKRPTSSHLKLRGKVGVDDERADVVGAALVQHRRRRLLVVVVAALALVLQHQHQQVGVGAVGAALQREQLPAAVLVVVAAAAAAVGRRAGHGHADKGVAQRVEASGSTQVGLPRGAERGAVASGAQVIGHRGGGGAAAAAARVLGDGAELRGGGGRGGGVRGQGKGGHKGGVARPPVRGPERACVW